MSFSKGRALLYLRNKWTFLCWNWFLWTIVCPIQGLKLILDIVSMNRKSFQWNKKKIRFVAIWKYLWRPMGAYLNPALLWRGCYEHSTTRPVHGGTTTEDIFSSIECLYLSIWCRLVKTRENSGFPHFRETPKREAVDSPCSSSHIVGRRRAG